MRFLHDSGSGGNRPPGVSNVTGLQPAAFAARHTLPRKLGWLFKESNLVLFSKHSAIKLQPLTILIRSPAPVRPQVLTVTPMWKKTHAADEFLPVHPVGMAGFEPATSCSQSRRATKLRHIPKTDVQVKGCTHILIPHDLNHKQQPQSGIKPVFPVHV